MRLIDADALKERIMECMTIWNEHTDYGQGRVRSYAWVIDLIAHASTIEARPIGKWIPVSERLPEETLNSVIGWDAYRERCVFVQYIDGHFQITGSVESFDIVAWLPLPQPYKEEAENEIDN